MRWRLECQRRKCFGDRAAMCFEPGGQHEALTEMLSVFIHREAGSVGRKLEQHATGFLEVDRLEPEPVDGWCRMRARCFDLCPHVMLMLLVVDAPRKVMDGADSPGPAPGLRCIAHVDHTGRSRRGVSRPATFLKHLLKPQNFRQ